MPKTRQIRSTGQITQRGPDKWLVRVFLGRDATGKRSYTSQTVIGTKKDAEAALAKLTVAANEQTVVTATKVTLKAHLATWLDSRVDISPKTLLDYRHRMEKDVIPFVGTTPLSKLTGEALQKLVTVLQTKRELGPRTIRYTFVILGQAVEDAVRQGLIAKSPTKYVKLPKEDHAEPSVLDSTQMQLFLECSAKGDYQKHALWTILLTSGMRPQEALALKWDDIAVTTAEDGRETCKITIVRALKQVDKSRWEVGEVKTKAGRRSIPVPMETWVALKAHKARQTAEILHAGAKYARNGYVFASRKHSPGHHLPLGTVRKWWSTALAEAGLPHRKLYASRHSHITALLTAGAHPKIAQERAGHSSINVTMDTYSHVLPSMQQAASDQIGQLLFKQA
jgi:integrase